MGKGTDKLYITHSEWASEDAFSASVGAGASKSKAVGASFKRLPFNFCAVSLQPFSHPVCTVDGTTFDLTNILPWIKKHGTNPVDGSPLKSSDLIKLHFSKNEEGEYVDPVTYKTFTNNSHIVALRSTGNVFAYDTVERLNIKAKNWRDLVNEEEFTRKDIITLQDPQNIGARDLSSFKYLKDGVSTLTPEQEQQRSQAVNSGAMGSSAKVLKAREAVERARKERETPNKNPALIRHENERVGSKNGQIASGSRQINGAAGGGKKTPYNAAQHTTGKAAASFTSTGLTPHTSGERALLSEEEYMLKPRRVKTKGYVRIQTNLGDLNVELHTEYAPKAVWNFIRLANKEYYNDVGFHRNIRNFMIQGGDPTGTGKGGSSIWGKNFNDEIDGPLTHDSRGILSMANKGKNTNSSQFFITYRAVPHLNRKHTIFGQVVGGTETLSKLENSPTDPSTNRPSDDNPLYIVDVAVLVDPFEEYQKQRQDAEDIEKSREEIRKQGGTEDEKVTWTGKRVRGGHEQGSGSSDNTRVGVGKYLHAEKSAAVNGEEDEIVGDWEGNDLKDEFSYAPPSKKHKAGVGGGFGNFDNW